jgi:hypothetical protein
MSPYSKPELTYLQAERRVGRLAIVGPGWHAPRHPGQRLDGRPGQRRHRDRRPLGRSVRYQAQAPTALITVRHNRQQVAIRPSMSPGYLQGRPRTCRAGAARQSGAG